MLTGFIYLLTRLSQVLIIVPIIGMFGWMTHLYSSNNELTPTNILVLFIVSVLALFWVLATTLFYQRSKQESLIISLADVGIMAGFIAGVVLLRNAANSNCNVGDTMGRILSSTDSGLFYHYGVPTSKACSLLKAGFALGIIEILQFAWTAFLMWRLKKKEETVVVYEKPRTYSRHERRSSRGSRSSRVSYDRASGYEREPRRRSRSRSRQPYV